MSTPDFTRPGPWRGLLASALTLTDHLATVIDSPFWTFGGGTVLMLRLNHRQSKDIDLFVPDPQYLGHITPRLSEAAESLTHDYAEAAEAVKLYLAEGEIDFVVGTPLTTEPFELVEYLNRDLRIETCAEIVAKKMHFRGQHAKARDLFDLCTVAELEPNAIEVARPFFAEHSAAFIEGLKANAAVAREEFKQIARLDYTRTFDECIAIAERVLR